MLVLVQFAVAILVGRGIGSPTPGQNRGPLDREVLPCGFGAVLAPPRLRAPPHATGTGVQPTGQRVGTPRTSGGGAGPHGAPALQAAVLLPSGPSPRLRPLALVPVAAVPATGYPSRHPLRTEVLRGVGVTRAALPCGRKSCGSVARGPSGAGPLAGAGRRWPWGDSPGPALWPARYCGEPVSDAGRPPSGAVSGLRAGVGVGNPPANGQ